MGSFVQMFCCKDMQHRPVYSNSFSKEGLELSLPLISLVQFTVLGARRFILGWLARLHLISTFVTKRPITLLALVVQTINGRKVERSARFTALEVSLIFKSELVPFGPAQPFYGCYRFAVVKRIRNALTHTVPTDGLLSGTSKS